MAKQQNRGLRVPWTLVIIAALILAFVLGWLKCGADWGVGGSGKGKGKGEGQGRGLGAGLGTPDGSVRCKVRIEARGLVMADAVVTQPAVVEACRGGEADVVVTGDARYGLYDDLKRALEAAGVRVYTADK